MAEETPEQQGLPSLSPDNIEETVGDEFDNIIPSRGYQMLPMVGLGGSAGSIPALQTFFQTMPPDSGLVFVVILHLAPGYESTLADLLQRSTTMKVRQVHETERVLRNHVYVIPPGKALASIDGHLQLAELSPERGKRVAVDLFFRTLADTHGPHSAAIVLSGADGDGAIGIKRIKERGGLTIAQDPDEAEHVGMPRAAIATGMVDWVLRVTEMPARLIAYHKQEGRLKLPPEEGPQLTHVPRPTLADGESALRDILSFLRTRTGRDFSYYKRATILRRISRRLQVNGLVDLPSYLTFLRTHPGESGALLQDLLISVTNFFRDREAFAALEQQVPELFKGKGPSDAVRVWVPACATGEEAYSIAMLLSEYARRLDMPPVVQVFATDLDEEVIQSARDGVYPEAITADVSEERLRRFFIKEHRGFRVRRELRETLLFAVHDLLKDSPFSRLDLISCRNLLIYLNRDAQARAFDIFHFALRPEGKLFLGSSESVEDGSHLFSVIDKKHRLYKHRPSPRVGLPVPSGPSTLALSLETRERIADRPVVPPNHGLAQVGIPSSRPELGEHRASSWGELHFRLIERYSPPSILVNQEHDIVHLSETAGRYLQFGGGEPTRNLLRCVHPALRIELRAALYRASQAESPVEVIDVPLDFENSRSLITLRIYPAQDLAPEYLLVVFESREASALSVPAQDSPHRAEPESVTRHLERELESMKSHLRDTVEQYEASNEELKASNEELQAMNEELRSATEELETSREELQSINEELTTVNQELKSKVDELGHTNSDLHNLMASTAIATVFLDRDLRITRYTPSAVSLFNLIITDVGRPLTDLKHRLDYPDLESDATSVLDRLVPIEREVGEAGGRWFLARLLPYRTLEDRIAGVVLTFVDITERKQADEEVRVSEARLRRMTEVESVGMIQFNVRGEITEANEAFLRLSGFTSDDIHQGRVRWDELTPPEHIESARQALETLRVTGSVTCEKEYLRKDGSRWWALFAGTMFNAEEGIEYVIDISERKRAEEELARGREELEDRVRSRTAELAQANEMLRDEVRVRRLAEETRAQLLERLVTAQEEERRRIARELHDQMGQLLAALLLEIRQLENTLQQSPEELERLHRAQSLADQIGREVHDLALELRPTALDDLGLVAALTNSVETWSARSNMPIEFHARGLNDERLPPPVETALYRIVQESLTNVAKHSKSSRASVVLERNEHGVTAIIEDDGQGFDVEGATGMQNAPSRLGLLGMRERLLALKGSLEIESSPGRGTTIYARIPLNT